MKRPLNAHSDCMILSHQLPCLYIGEHRACCCASCSGWIAHRFDFRWKIVNFRFCNRGTYVNDYQRLSLAANEYVRRFSWAHIDWFSSISRMFIKTGSFDMWDDAVDSSKTSLLKTTIASISWMGPFSLKIVRFQSEQRQMRFVSRNPSDQSKRCQSNSTETKYSWEKSDQGWWKLVKCNLPSAVWVKSHHKWAYLT